MYIGGQGEDTARSIYEGGDATSIAKYGRIEAFKDQRNAIAGELPTWWAEEIDKNKENITFTVTISDTQQFVFGIDYGLGTIVSVNLPGGITMKDIVRQVKIELSGTDEVITPTIGTPNSSGATYLRVLDDVKDLRSRLNLLEKR